MWLRHKPAPPDEEQFNAPTAGRHSFIRAHTKPPQSCDERKPAPPNEEQFNAPTTGGRTMNPIAAVLTSRGNSKKETDTIADDACLLFSMYGRGNKKYAKHVNLQ
ncbi:MAG: hypothetical protein IJ277_03305 [Bacteroidaceae bacterium]|nr:hypothetical protein [Bacteroidaceae bacterium]